MQKKILIFISFLFSLTIIQCGGETENKNEEKKLNDIVTDKLVEDSDSPDVQNAINENGNFQLNYHFNEGGSFEYRLTTISHTVRSMKTDTTMGDVFDQKIIRTIKFNTISVENDSIAEIKCIVTNTSVEVDVNGEKVTYQSGSKSASEEVKKFIEYEGLINNPFHFRITKYGELLDVFEVDKVTNSYLELSGMMDSVKVEEKTIFKKEIVNNLLIPLLGQIFKELPKQQVKVESTWEKVMDPAPVLVFTIQYTNHYKVTDLQILNNEKMAVIDGVATIIVEGESKHTNNGINYTFNQPESEASGKIFFNLNTGRVQKSESETFLEISYSSEMISPKGVIRGISTEIMSNNNILELL